MAPIPENKPADSPPIDGTDHPIPESPKSSPAETPYDIPRSRSRSHGQQIGKARTRAASDDDDLQKEVGQRGRTPPKSPTAKAKDSPTAKPPMPPPSPKTPHHSVPKHFRMDTPPGSPPVKPYSKASSSSSPPPKATGNWGPTSPKVKPGTREDASLRKRTNSGQFKYRVKDKDDTHDPVEDTDSNDEEEENVQQQPTNDDDDAVSYTHLTLPTILRV